MNRDPHQATGPATGPEEDRELWELLARAKRPEASPYFARRVLREAASLPQSAPASALWRGLKAWWQAGLPILRPPRAAAWPGAVAAMVICTFTLLASLHHNGANLNVGASMDDGQWVQPQAVVAAAMDTSNEVSAETTAVADEEPDATVNPATDETLTPLDAEVIADLDSLMTRAETHLWTDDNPAF